MKKQLLTSTALIAAGLLAAGGAAHAQKKMAKKPSITVNGYMEQIIGFNIDQDENVVGEKVNVDVHGESEVHFNGTAKLDNGISLRAHWEIEGAGDGAPGSDILDEVYLIVRGSFGQLTIGSEDNAGHLMTIGYAGSWATQVGQNLAFDISDWIQPPGTTPFLNPKPSATTGKGGFLHAFDGTVNDIRLRSGDNDSDKITYYTPRFSGFQLGASYIPTQEQDAGSTTTAVSEGYHDGFAIGANFDRKFDKFGLGVAAGYLTMDAPEGSLSDGIPSDYDAWTVAMRVDFGGFRVSGAYKQNNDLFRGLKTSTDFKHDKAGTPVPAKAQSPSTASLDGEIFDVGVRYRWGPNGVSLTYSHGEQESSTAVSGDDEKDAAMLSYSRALGPGVKWTANLMWAEYDGEDIGSGDDNDGYAFTTSIRMGF